MKIVLTRPAFISYTVSPPLGIGYLSSFLRKHQIDVSLIDGQRDSLSLDELVDHIVAEKPDAVGITCMTTYFRECAELCRQLKARDIRCIIGGVHPTFLPYQTLRDSRADFVICGEAENSLLKLIKAGFEHAGILGIYAQGDLVSEPDCVVQSEPVTALDSLPFPDWQQMLPSSYPRSRHESFVKHFPVAAITTTRGCPYPCTFCASPGFYQSRIRFRSPQNVVDEIEYLVSHFGVREIRFEDDNLTFKREHVENICRMIMERDIKVSWSCPNGIRADKVDEDLIHLMKKSGCHYFSLGVESANPQILRNIKKQESIEAINEAINVADKAGISCDGFFIFGLPGETPETIEETIQFAVSSRLSGAEFFILDVLPGSELWTSLHGRFTPNFEKHSYKEPEWLPQGISRDMLIKALRKAYRRFYFRPLFFFRRLRSIRPSRTVFWLQKRFLKP